MEEAAERASKAVIGAAIEVHRALGPGYLESVYEEALAVELRLRGVSFQRQLEFALNYKGSPIGTGRLDFLVESCLIVELKAVEALGAIHTAQAISYLKATGHRLALIINFNVPMLTHGIRRVAL
jgi:GxxExxY protein